MKKNIRYNIVLLLLMVEAVLIPAFANPRRPTTTEYFFRRISESGSEKEPELFSRKTQCEYC